MIASATVADFKTSKAQTRALYPVFSLKIWFYSYLVENSQKATLNFSDQDFLRSLVNSKYI